MHTTRLCTLLNRFTFFPLIIILYWCWCQFCRNFITHLIDTQALRPLVFLYVSRYKSQLNFNCQLYRFVFVTPSLPFGFELLFFFLRLTSIIVQKLLIEIACAWWINRRYWSQFVIIKTKLTGSLVIILDNDMDFIRFEKKVINNWTLNDTNQFVKPIKLLCNFKIVKKCVYLSLFYRVNLYESGIHV